MGKILPEVEASHLFFFQYERVLLEPFLLNFDVTHDKELRGLGTSISAYLLSPDDIMRKSFGFSSELLLFLSRFEFMQPRTLQLIEKAYTLKPFDSRADFLTYFILSNDDGIEDWFLDYLAQHPQTRTPIPITNRDAITNGGDPWFIRNRLSRKLYSRDLFDYQLPLDNDLFFFGRALQIDEFADAIRKGQNRGLFGLRKTGKTSLLFKLIRICSENKLAMTIYLDCKRPDVREKTWKQMLVFIIIEILKKKKAEPRDLNEDNAIQKFSDILSSSKPQERICIIFDEIEYISPVAILDTHWHVDFTHFWQTMWSLQSQYRSLSFVIAGVNPYTCEVDLVNKVQNPMFGIVKPSHLTGLSRIDTKQMTTVLGRRMGLNFDDGAIDYLFKRYGGHPLLTRMACSNINQNFQLTNVKRPIEVTSSFLKSSQEEREEDLYFYCRHVVSELAEFYNDEYVLLEMLASGEIVDFMELAAEPGWVKHLKSYGIISVEKSRRASIIIPVIQRYVAGEKSRKSRERSLRTIIPVSKREAWLTRRKANILHDMKLLLRQMTRKNLWSPYGSQFLPEADVFQICCVAIDWQSFGSFINAANKCFVEKIDIANGGKNIAFFTKLKNQNSELFKALHRIRVYRNNADHLRMNQVVEKIFNQFIDEDFLGYSMSQVDEPWFLMQQTCIDELFAAIQLELDGIS